MTDSTLATVDNRSTNQPVIQPMVHSYSSQSNPCLCFVLMPFRPDLDEIYEDVVKPTVAKPPVGMECLRADEIYSVQEVMNDVWAAVLSARVVIADLTHRNPNVMYELGIAHAFGKKTILLTQDISDVPFDLQHHRCIVYDRGPRGLKKLRNALTKTIQFILSESPAESYLITNELKEARRLRVENQRLIEEAHLLRGRRFLRARDDLEPLEQLADEAADIFIAGPTLALVAMKQGFFRRKAREGCHLRFVIPNPDPGSAAVQGLLANWHTSPDGFLSELRSALVNLHILEQSVAGAVAGSVEFRYVQSGLTLSLLMIDGNSKKGHLRVEMLPFNTPSADRPLFELRAVEGTPWYDFFRERCDQLWCNALPLDARAWTS